MQKTDKQLSFKELPGFLWHEIQILFQLLKDAVSKKYEGLEIGKVILILTGIIYLVSPIDIVPDFLPMVGLADDIAVLAWIIKTLSSEIEEYKVWKKSQPIELDIAE